VHLAPGLVGVFVDHQLVQMQLDVICAKDAFDELEVVGGAFQHIPIVPKIAASREG
jgi:hypothetical protein